VHLGRATTLRTSSDIQEVGFSDGSVASGRLLVLASGTQTRLQDQIPVQRRMVSPKHSLHLGFDLGPARSFAGHAESLSYREESANNAIDFITLFPIHNTLRANVFTYWDARDPMVRNIRQKGLEPLLTSLPHLARVAGAFHLSSKVECMAIDLYRTEQAVIPGVILLGDVFQSVCPSTGTGLSKVLVDVQTLLHLVPKWLQTAGMNSSKIHEFYSDERKQRTDEDSLHAALYRRNLCTDHSMGWRLRRWKKYFPRWLAGVASCSWLAEYLGGAV
jgi:2-polyprenyl-6-methoxyphenol hydroxylase-like FAD-dependent oxidoreductase